MVKIFFIVLFTNLITFVLTIIYSKKIIHKIEMEISKLMFKKIVKNAKNKEENVEGLTFDDIFEKQEDI